MKILLGTKISMSYLQNYVISVCTVAGFHCMLKGSIFKHPATVTIQSFWKICCRRILPLLGLECPYYLFNRFGGPQDGFLLFLLGGYPIRRFVDYFSGAQGAFEDTLGTVPTMFFVLNFFPMSKGTVFCDLHHTLSCFFNCV